MNIRLDSESLRVRVSREEASRIAQGELLCSTYPAAGLSLEAVASPAGEMTFSGFHSEHAKLHVPRAQLDALLALAQGAEAKRDTLSIRSGDVIFEIDFFDVKRRRSPNPG